MEPPIGDAVVFGMRVITDSDIRGWGIFKALNQQPCQCGHQQWEHKGLREPGCGHLGTCTCTQFQASLKETA